MTFSTTMANALSGIAASTLRAEILSFNIANAQTDNFAKRSVSFEPQTPGGVRALGVARADAGRSEELLLDAQSRAEGASVRSNALTRINSDFGEPGDADGLYASGIRFQQSLEDLRLTPESLSAQTNALRAAQDLAETFNRLDADAQAIRLDADREIGRSVNRLNGSFRELVELNKEARVARGISLDNIAERQQGLVAEISRELDVDVSGNYGEALTIRTRGGFILVGVEAGELAFNPAGNMSQALSYVGGTLSGLTINGIDITPGTVQGLQDGSLAARFAVRDTLAFDYGERLDRAAVDLEERVTSATGNAASPGLFVIEAGAGSSASRLRINPLVDPAQGGELYRIRDGAGATAPGPEGGEGVIGDLLDALDRVATTTIVSTVDGRYNFIDSLGALSTALGTQALRGQEIDRSATDALTTASTEVQRIIGVDTDRELQDLLLVEQAFAANARVIQAADEMLQQLLQV
ncbi:MAG: hypothetical protein HRU11_10070 [Parvularculaceae bacterium]|nr:hypothetical protein [Parvularculaceae bacterium]